MYGTIEEFSDALKDEPRDDDCARAHDALADTRVHLINERRTS